jgi:endoglucanase
MQQSGVWIGASWWAAGPWWPATVRVALFIRNAETDFSLQYFTSIEPPNGLSIAQVLPQALMPYL